MTKRLRGIWHAWHFQFALSLVVTALCGSFCSACLHPLTRRYVTIAKTALGDKSRYGRGKDQCSGISNN
ncbi:TPA: DUF3265 domain-containing protein [Vibrio vulnificus]|nr:DUF3265 domain-containing protein [Vibrio vulnificus]